MIALVIMLAGILTLTKMPIAQYPTIAPPTVTIAATYPGASAETVENTVTQIIEQQMNGLDGLRYISSNSAGNGQASIQLNFEQGVDLILHRFKFKTNCNLQLRFYLKMYNVKV